MAGRRRRAGVDAGQAARGLRPAGVAAGQGRHRSVAPGPGCRGRTGLGSAFGHAAAAAAAAAGRHLYRSRRRRHRQHPGPAPAAPAELAVSPPTCRGSSFYAPTATDRTSCSPPTCGESRRASCTSSPSNQAASGTTTWPATDRQLPIPRRAISTATTCMPSSAPAPPGGVCSTAAATTASDRAGRPAAGASRSRGVPCRGRRGYTCSIRTADRCGRCWMIPASSASNRAGRPTASGWPGWRRWKTASAWCA